MNNWEFTLEVINALLALGLVAMAWRTLRRFTFPLQRKAVRMISGAMVFFLVREMLAFVGSYGTLLWIQIVREASETITTLLAIGALWSMWQSEQREVETLRKEADRDALTGLYNRRYFIQKAEPLIRRWKGDPEQLWLLLLDVDDFKTYNDTYGHDAGDVALKRIASVLRASLRQSDLVARFGGEEFVVLIQGSDEAHRVVIDRIQANIATMCLPDEELHRKITVSIGVATWSPHHNTLNALIKAADRALYRAKWSGKNQACFYDPRLDGEGTIVHLCPRMDWEAAQQAGAYRPTSLDTEGFIHCSRPEQIAGVAERFFQGQRDLVLLWIDPALVRAPIRWEATDGELFPHIYGPLNLDAVIRVTAFPEA